MKKRILFFLIYSSLCQVINAQYLSYTVSPPSCSTCCDGNMTITIDYCFGTTIIFPTPTVSLLSYTANTLHYTNCCNLTYTFTTAATDVCPSVTQAINASIATGVDEQTGILSAFSIYPNPVGSALHIDAGKFAGSKISVSILSYLGEVLDQRPLDEAGNLPMNNYLSGIYFVKIQVGGAQRMFRVLKE